MTVRTREASVRVTGGLLAVAAGAWLVVIHMTEGMSSVPGTMGLGAVAFVGLRTVMMAAMMLPALVPLSVVHAGEGPGRIAPVTGLGVGYLIVWAAFGLLALLVSAGAARIAARSESLGEWIGAALLIGAGLYQFSPLKDRCLALCRSPLHILMRAGAFRGPARHVRAGAAHGAYCVGCCWSLMVALMALGVMDVGWMVAFTVVITLEKIWRHGARVAVAVGIALIVLGLLAPWHPGIVPGLHEAPTSMGGM